MTEVACCICLIEFPSWKVNNPRYCCSALICQDCAKDLNKCPQCRHQSPTDIVDSESDLDSEGNGVQMLIETPTFKVELITEEGEDDVEHFRYLEISHYKDGKLHHDSGPARVTYRENGLKIFERWYRNGLEHREGRAAIIRYHDNGKVERKDWVINGVVCRGDDRPTSIHYHENGNIYMEVWYKENWLRHRDNDMPAEIEYYENAEIKSLRYYKDGKLHREGKPANIIYYEDGTIQVEQYIEHDRGIENDKGICLITYDRDGKKTEYRLRNLFTIGSDRRILPGTVTYTVPADLDNSYIVFN